MSNSRTLRPVTPRPKPRRQIPTAPRRSRSRSRRCIRRRGVETHLVQQAEVGDGHDHVVADRSEQQNVRSARFFRTLAGHRWSLLPVSAEGGGPSAGYSGLPDFGCSIRRQPMTRAKQPSLGRSDDQAAAALCALLYVPKRRMGFLELAAKSR